MNLLLPSSPTSVGTRAYPPDTILPLNPSDPHELAAPIWSNFGWYLGIRSTHPSNPMNSLLWSGPTWIGTQALRQVTPSEPRPTD
jgi:hypothetical protein